MHFHAVPARAIVWAESLFVSFQNSKQFLSSTVRFQGKIAASFGIGVTVVELSLSWLRSYCWSLAAVLEQSFFWLHPRYLADCLSQRGSLQALFFCDEDPQLYCPSVAVTSMRGFR